MVSKSSSTSTAYLIGRSFLKQPHDCFPPRLRRWWDRRFSSLPQSHLHSHHVSLTSSLTSDTAVSMPKRLPARSMIPLPATLHPHRVLVLATPRLDAGRVEHRIAQLKARALDEHGAGQAQSPALEVVT